MMGTSKKLALVAEDDHDQPLKLFLWCQDDPSFEDDYGKLIIEFGDDAAWLTKEQASQLRDWIEHQYLDKCPV